MPAEKSYRQILKASSIMGGAAVFVMLLGLIRTKFVAVLIGSVGVGLLASFTSIQAFVSTLSGLGLGSSAVRDIATAMGKDDQRAIARAACTLRRLSWFTGLVGACLLAISSRFLSKLTFDSYDYAPDIAALGIVVLVSGLSTAQLALLQGMRRVGDMARANVYGTAAGTLFGVLFYHLMGLRGILPALIAASIVQFVFAWQFVRKLPIVQVQQTWRETIVQSRSMVGLGFSLMWSSLLISAVGYVTIYLINRYGSVQSVGLYSAAFVLSGVFVNFVLNAMGADYYPRLTGMADNNVAMRNLVNEQMEIGLLLALPGLAASIVLAPWLVRGLYSSEFMPAVPLLQWFILGCLGRVISWPMGFVILAKGKGKWLFITETSFNALHAAMVAIGLWLVGIEGVAIAFCLLYVGHVCAMFFVARRLIGFGWEAATAKLVVGSVALLVLIFIISRSLPVALSFGLGIVLVIASGVFCLHRLLRRTGAASLVVQKIRKIPGIKFLLEG